MARRLKIHHQRRAAQYADDKSYLAQTRSSPEREQAAHAKARQDAAALAEVDAIAKARAPGGSAKGSGK